MLAHVLLTDSERKRVIEEEQKNKPFDAHENRKLTDDQVDFFRQSFYAYSEEIDIFLCQEKERDLVKDTDLDESSLKRAVARALKQL